jgi:hypothetical protein
MAFMDLSDCILFSGDARLADYGSLLVFRHWLRCQLQELAGLDDAALYPFRGQCSSDGDGVLEPAARSGSARLEVDSYGRLFF